MFSACDVRRRRTDLLTLKRIIKVSPYVAKWVMRSRHGDTGAGMVLRLLRAYVRLCKPFTLCSHRGYCERTELVTPITAQYYPELTGSVVYSVVAAHRPKVSYPSCYCGTKDTYWERVDKIR